MSNLLLTLSVLLAQAPPPPDTSNIQVTRSWTMEIVICAVFVIAAIFAVTRRSNRA